MSSRAVVIGLGRSGWAVVRSLRAEGWAVTVVDDALDDARSDTPADARGVGGARSSPRTEAEALGVDVVERPPPEAWPALVDGVDLVVPSPGVAPAHAGVRAARAAGRVVRGEVDLAAERLSVPMVAVTGTNGKSTVTALVAAMLEASGVAATAAGNIGRPLLDLVDDPPDVVVAEVSSFQLATTTPAFAPAVAVVLAVAEDHVDWHGSRQAYVDAKAAIVAHQTPGDIVVHDGDDPVATEIARRGRARRMPCSIDPSTTSGFRVAGNHLVDDTGTPLVAVAELRRSLPHDLTDALVAAAAALAAGASHAGVGRALRAWSGLPHRVATVGDAGGVRWIDDSKATNPHATLHAVRAFDSVVLLAGGRDKGLDLTALRGAADRIRHVVAFGEAGPAVAAVFEGVRPAEVVPGIAEAVRSAASVARPGDVVLLSPGCASFDHYDGYAQRGDHFASEVGALLGPSSRSGASGGVS